MIYYEGRDIMNERRVLFCNIAYMKYYRGITKEDMPVNGGRYVREESDAMEKYNFLSCDDGLCRGYVEVSHVNGYKAKDGRPKRIGIERIDNNFKDKDAIDGMIVIFFAKPDKGEHVIVGWYENATVYRNYQLYKGRFYNIAAKADDCKLIEYNNRNFIIPKGPKDNKRYGFSAGQSNIWYADRTDAEKEFREKVLKYIHKLDM